MSDLTIKPKFRKLRAKLGLHASWSEIFYVHRKETEHLRQPEAQEKYRQQHDDHQPVTTKRWHSSLDTNQSSAIYANPGYDSLADMWEKSSVSDCGTLSKSSASDYGTLSSISSRPSPRPRSKPNITGEKEVQQEQNSDYASWDSGDMKDSDYSDDCLTATSSHVDDGLNDFCDYFERRKNAVQKWAPTVTLTKPTPVEEKMGHLRTQIASLVAQDDTLFKQLLTLHSAINDLKVHAQPLGLSTPSSSDSDADESESDLSEEHIYSEIDASNRRRSTQKPSVKFEQPSFYLRGSQFVVLNHFPDGIEINDQRGNQNNVSEKEN
ncbi:uncharacterized protein LOC136035278 isoform X2 [Artemia franciscana]|uniref:uncharacterized protein LOC136035278 isoform X2 n=1 Tax=Artemia franciscana TaxID=6661 RepID=UPI0032DA9CDC